LLSRSSNSAGQTPFNAKEMIQGGLDAMRKTIREKEPVRPSMRLTQKLLSGGPALHLKSQIKNRKSQIHSQAGRALGRCASLPIERCGESTSLLNL
jgi:hypothetical protein